MVTQFGCKGEMIFHVDIKIPQIAAKCQLLGVSIPKECVTSKRAYSEHEPLLRRSQIRDLGSLLFQTRPRPLLYLENSAVYSRVKFSESDHDKERVGKCNKRVSHRKVIKSMLHLCHFGRYLIFFVLIPSLSILIHD